MRDRLALNLRVLVCLTAALAACEAKSTAADATDAPADAGDAAAADAPDAATATDAAADVTAIACSTAQVAACDDHNPCTLDTCAGPDGSCSHSGAASPCDDADPCTVNDACAAGSCKGVAKDCDDKSPCTIDNCQLDGSCTHVHNQHEDCLPLIAVTTPPRGLRLHSADPQLAVQGKLVAQNSAPAALTVQGQPVPFAADGSFSTTVPLQFGAQPLVLAVTDQFGGTRVQVQALHWSPQWQPGDQPIAAGDVRLAGQADGSAWAAGVQDALAGAGMQVPQPFVTDVVSVLLGWQVALAPALGDGSAHLALTVLPQPVTVDAGMAATPTTDPGTPLLAGGCAAPGTLGLDGGAPVQWTTTYDALNAALRAAWLGGALTGDVSPIGAGLAPGFTVMGQIHGNLPWLLQDCPGPSAVLRLGELELAIQAYIGDPPELLATAVAHIALDVTPNFAIAGDKVQLWLGPMQAIQLDIATGSKDMQATDVHVAMAKALHDTSVPALLKAWAKAPLVEIALPGSGMAGAHPWAWTFVQTLVPAPGRVRADGAPESP